MITFETFLVIKRTGVYNENIGKKSLKGIFTMKKGRGNRPTIGIMLGDVESDYTVELVRGFYSCAREENVNIVFMLGPQIPQYCSRYPCI